jgi:hypothetical protein
MTTVYAPFVKDTLQVNKFLVKTPRPDRHATLKSGLHRKYTDCRFGENLTNPAESD